MTAPNDGFDLADACPGTGAFAACFDAAGSVVAPGCAARHYAGPERAEPVSAGAVRPADDSFTKNGVFHDQESTPLVMVGGHRGKPGRGCLGDGP